MHTCIPIFLHGSQQYLFRVMWRSSSEWVDDAGGVSRLVNDVMLCFIVEKYAYHSVAQTPFSGPKLVFVFYFWGDHWWRYSGSMVNKEIPWCHEYQKLSRRVCLKIEYHQNKPGLSSLSHHKMGLSQVLDDPMCDMWMLRKKPCTMVRWPALPHCWL